jgi:hypothetical protein
VGHTGVLNIFTIYALATRTTVNSLTIPPTPPTTAFVQEFFKLDTMPLKVLVLGHSFVRRLETDIINQVHPVLSPN